MRLPTLPSANAIGKRLGADNGGIQGGRIYLLPTPQITVTICPAPLRVFSRVFRLFRGYLSAPFPARGLLI